jgi:S-adenosylmethionine-diacylglycerol 3-amino-3-carboxypropyl transferase
VEEQRRIYDQGFAKEVWNPLINWLLNRQTTLSLLGVPHPQRRLVQSQYPTGVGDFIKNCVEYVIHNLPLSENYFWRVYLTGEYSKNCCPNYLKEENFLALKGGLVNCIETHTCTVTEFLKAGSEPISRFVMLDHMDWMSSYYPSALQEEWDATFERASPNARLILRSAISRPPFFEWIRAGRDQRPLAEVLHFETELANRLQGQDRVHTYPGFFIAKLDNHDTF